MQFIVNFFELMQNHILQILCSISARKIIPMISSIRIYQTDERIYLEYTKDWSVSTNVEKIIELDDYSMSMCVGEIFTNE